MQLKPDHFPMHQQSVSLPVLRESHACSDSNNLTLSSFKLSASSHPHRVSLKSLKSSRTAAMSLHSQSTDQVDPRRSVKPVWFCSLTASQLQQSPALLSNSKYGAAHRTVAPAPGGRPTGEASLTEEPVRNEALNCAKLLFSGAMSAVVSRTCVAPLERVKMDLLLNSPTSTSALSTATNVFRNEGLRGFWKGNLLNVLRTAPFKALNFFSFDMYRKLFTKLSGGSDGNMERFAAGAAAGITATLVCFPLDVLRTRVLAHGGHKYAGGPLQTLMSIVRFEGVGALYAGCLPAVIAMAPAGAVFYGVYDMLKANHLEAMAAQQQQQQPAGQEAGVSTSRPPLELPAAYTLLYGGLAGLSSEVVVYPLEVLRRKMQLQSMLHAATAAAAHGGVAGGRCVVAAAAASEAAPALMLAAQQLAAVAGAIAARGGVAGFYAGVVPNLLQVLPSSALSYYTYETVKRMTHAVS